MGLLYLSGYHTKQDEFIEQPIQFSHAHHVGGMGTRLPLLPHVGRGVGVRQHPADQDVHELPLADLENAPILEPVRASFRDDTPLAWTRVHDLPDFVYFNHSIHVKKGVGCATCHGPVDKMPLMYQKPTLHDEWCLDCHRNPEKYVRPRDQVFNMAWERPADDPGLGARLVKEYKIARRRAADELLDVPPVEVN